MRVAPPPPSSEQRILMPVDVVRWKNQREVVSDLSLHFLSLAAGDLRDCMVDKVPYPLAHVRGLRSHRLPEGVLPSSLAQVQEHGKNEIAVDTGHLIHLLEPGGKRKDPGQRGRISLVRL